jgi:hypothetical protein
VTSTISRSLCNVFIALVLAVTSVGGLAVSASGAEQIDLLDPMTLMSTLAPDKETPTSEEVTLEQSPPSPIARSRMLEPQRLTISADEFETQTSVTLDGSVSFADQVGDYSVYSNGDATAAVYAKPTPAGAQIIFAAANKSELSSFRVAIPLNMSTVDSRADGSLFVDQTDGAGLFIRAPWARDANGADLPSRYEFDGSVLVQKVDVTARTAYPVIADPAWDYTNDYGVGSTTPEVAQLTLHGCFDCSFPVPGAPRNFPSAGQALPLTVGPWSFACTFRNEDYRPIPGHHAWGFIFDAASGHVDGIGSWISFDFFQKAGESTYTLRVYGYIVNDNPTGLGRPAYLTGATANWFVFAQNMSNITILT